MTAQGFDAGMVLLMSSFPGYQVTEATMKAWRALLSDLDDSVFLRAMMVVCQGAELYPGTNVAALVRKAAAQFAQNAHPLAGEAWGEVKRAVRQYGYYREPQFSDPLIAEAIRALGWQDYCSSRIDDEPSWRAQFIRLYESMCEREQEQKVHALASAEVEKILPGVSDVGKLPVRT